MAFGRMNRLIGAAISSNDAQRIRIHIILGRQELYCGVHVCRHQFQNLPGLGGEICKFAALALSEPPEVKGQDVISRCAQHRPELIVELVIRIALV